MLSMNRRSHVIRHVLTLQIFGILKKLRFWRNREEVLNQLNFASWGEQHKGHVQGSRGDVTCRGNVQGSRARGIQVARSDLYLWMGGVITVQTLWIKRRCQLVVRLKANKYYQKLLRYLSSYINLLNIRLCSSLWPSHECYWRCNQPRVCPNCIADYIALIANLIANRIALLVLLIALLWLYCSSHIINCFAFDRIALIVFMLESILCFWYHSHYLTSKYKGSKT